MNPETKQQVIVIAHYSDGTTRDVTRIATYEPNVAEMAAATTTGLITTSDIPGDVAIMIRFQSQVAVFRDLKRAQHTAIDMTAADHRKRIRVMEDRAAGQQGNRLLAGIDQFFVFLARRGFRTHAEDAVFAMKDDLAILGQEISHQLGLPDAEIDE